MTNVLTPSSGDLSAKLLDRVIGPGWQNLFVNGAQGGHLTLLGHMFSVWNTLFCPAWWCCFRSSPRAASFPPPTKASRPIFIPHGPRSARWARSGS